MNFKKSLILFIVFVFAYSAQHIHAETVKSATVATVNIYNAAILAQQENKITVSFDIFNRTGIQPKIIYAVLLYKSAEKSVIVDKRIYTEDVLTLSAGQTIRKQIAYKAPEFLSGTFSIGLEARNSDGLPLSIVHINNQLNLKGTDEQIEVNPRACFLTVEGEPGNIKYSPTQNVDISAQEDLTVNCSLKSTFKSTVRITPVFETYYRSDFGELINSNKKEPLTIEPGRTIDFSSQIRKGTEPQAYFVVLNFLNDQGKPISSPVDFKYILRGKSATIQNLTIDKDRYAKGDIAAVKVYWTGSPDSFPGARGPALRTDAKKIVVAISNGSGVSCAEEYSRDIGDKKSGGVENISIPINANCKDPHINASITDSNGKVLAENSYAVESQRVPLPKSLITSIVVAVIALALFFILRYFRKRNSIAGTIALILLSITSGMYSDPSIANADTLFFEGSVPVTATINLDRSSYNAGDTIIASGSINVDSCNPSLTDLSLAASTNGPMTIDVFSGPNVMFAHVNDCYASGSMNLTPQSTSGTYDADFLGFVQMGEGWYIAETGTAVIPYSVTAAPPPPPPVVNPPAILGCGQDFTSSGSVTIPAGVTGAVQAKIVGGGGGGGGAEGHGDNHAGGGGGSGGYRYDTIAATAGQVVNVTVGAGGNPGYFSFNGSYICGPGGTTGSKNGSNGQSSSVSGNFGTVTSTGGQGAGGSGIATGDTGGDNCDGYSGTGGSPNGVAGGPINCTRNSYGATAGGSNGSGSGSGGSSNASDFSCPTSGQNGFVRVEWACPTATPSVTLYFE